MLEKYTSVALHDLAKTKLRRWCSRFPVVIHVVQGTHAKEQ